MARSLYVTGLDFRASTVIYTTQRLIHVRESAHVAQSIWSFAKLKACESCQQSLRVRVHTSLLMFDQTRLLSWFMSPNLTYLATSYNLANWLDISQDLLYFNVSCSNLEYSMLSKPHRWGDISAGMLSACNFFCKLQTSDFVLTLRNPVEPALSISTEMQRKSTTTHF